MKLAHAERDHLLGNQGGGAGAALKPEFSPAHYPYVLQRQDTSSCHMSSDTRLTPV